MINSSPLSGNINPALPFVPVPFCLWKTLRTRPRRIPPVLLPDSAHCIHPSVFTRQKVSPLEHEPYHPTRLLAVGQSATAVIRARKHFCCTGIYLQPGAYVFSARGTWSNGRESYDWRGTAASGRFTAGDIARGAASVLGAMEQWFRKLTKNNRADFITTRRLQHAPWFCLVGLIANDYGRLAHPELRTVEHDGSAAAHQCVALCEYSNTENQLRITHPGYLYCFANDTWNTYRNNSGEITVRVSRVG